MRLKIILITFFSLYSSLLTAKIKFLNKRNLVVYQNHLLLEFKGCKKFPTVTLAYDDLIVPVEAKRSEFKNQFFINYQVPNVEYLIVNVTCGKKEISMPFHLKHFENLKEIGDQISENMFLLESSKKQKWDWGPAILLTGLGEYSKHSNISDEINHYISSYFSHWFLKGLPVIDWADKVAPGLAAFIHYQKGNTWVYPLVNKVIDFLKTTPRNNLNTIDHFGTSWMSHFFPSSIWVDSLVMWGLPAFYVGLKTGDRKLVDLTVDSLITFAEKLLDHNSGLMLHAWNNKGEKPFPKNNVPWLRGNGWFMVSLINVLELLSDNDPRKDIIKNIFIDLSYALKTYQLKTGGWDTLASLPGKGYQEVSGSALVSFSLLKGIRLGLLDEEFYQSAFKARDFVFSHLSHESGGYINVHRISWLTMPYSKLGYKVLPLKKNMDYGVGAVFLMLSELFYHDSFKIF